MHDRDDLNKVLYLSGQVVDFGLVFLPVHVLIRLRVLVNFDLLRVVLEKDRLDFVDKFFDRVFLLLVALLHEHPFSEGSLEIFGFKAEHLVYQDLCKVELVFTFVSRLIQVFHNVLDNVLLGSFFWTINAFEQRLCPDYAVDNLLRLLSDGAHREGLILFPLNALVAWRLAFGDAYASHVVAIGSCIDEGLAKIETHLVHMFSGLLVVQCIYDKVKIAEKREAESLFLDLAQVSLHPQVRILFLDLFFEDRRLGLVNVLSSEQKLSVEVAHIDRVEVDDLHFQET